MRPTTRRAAIIAATSKYQDRADIHSYSVLYFVSGVARAG
jgi:hypothetical protein